MLKLIIISWLRYQIININVPLSFEVLYFGKIDVLHLRKRDDNKIMRIMILASKITASVWLEMDNCRKTWKGWLQYIGEYRSDFV